ncbi:hypothetical protein MYU51_000047 [Penicillium brevicompactum]
MSPSQQPSELIYCTASVCVFPRDSANICVADDAISIEPRKINHNTRAQESQLFTVSWSLVLATRALNIDIAPELPLRIQNPHKKVALRRVLTCLAPRSHRLHTTNGGVYEPLAVPLARSYPITTRAFFEATTGEGDKLATTSCQHGMNGDALMKTFERSANFMNGFLVDRIPGIQWVNLIVLGWHLASFQSWNSKRPRNAGGFVHSPAFWKRRPESAMNQNTTWLEWCCIALPKRIRTKRALCELYEQASLNNSSKCSPPPMRSHIVYHFHITTAASTMSQCSGHNGPVLPCLGIRTPRKDSLLVDQIPDVQWVILIILDSNLTSFDAWQLDRHRGELMFQSDSWRTSPTFADEHAMNIGHISTNR